MRIGQGIDVHAFGPGDHVMLGGVRVPHDRGLVAHSDGDVVIHALCDAMLGALALGDIGQHFPPSDPRWKDVGSRHFLLHCAALMIEHGYALANADITIVCERPKIAPHVEAMRRNLATDLGCAIGDVSVKATTSENLGFTGRGEGIAAFALVLLQHQRASSTVAGAGKPDLHALVGRVELDPLRNDAAAALRARRSADHRDPARRTHRFPRRRDPRFRADGRGRTRLPDRSRNPARIPNGSRADLPTAAGVAPLAVGFAGLKDRHAITRQSFTVQLPGRADPDWSALAIPGVRVLAATRHNRKLKRGAHRGNRFRIRVRNVRGDLRHGRSKAHGDRRRRGAELFRRAALRPRRRQSRAGRGTVCRPARMRTPAARLRALGGALGAVQRAARRTRRRCELGSRARRRGVDARRHAFGIRSRAVDRRSGRAPGGVRHPSHRAAVGPRRPAQQRRVRAFGTGDRSRPRVTGAGSGKSRARTGTACVASGRRRADVRVARRR